MSAELKTLSAALEKLTAGRNLEGRAKQLAFNISQQLKRANKLVSRGKPLDAVSRKFIVQDIEELQTLLASLPPKNGEA